MNPRIQVEHTVTEEVTDVDLVVAQMRIASGETFDDARPAPGRHPRARASRCSAGSRPRTPPTASAPTPGTITVYRSAGGGGVRLDGGTVFVGAEVSAHFDSMLVKLTCRGTHLPDRRASGPAGAGGVPDPRRLDQHPASSRRCSPTRCSRRGEATTRSSTSAPSCSPRGCSADRGTKLLTYLADVTVNQPHGPATTRRPPAHQAAGARPRGARCRPGSRDLLVRGRARPSSPAQLRGRTDVAGHRHDLPRRPPVAARDPHAHPRPAPRRRARLAPHARAALDGGVGRRDLRRRAALPRRGPVGAARRCCARRCPTSRCRCCCAGATPSATRPTRPRSPTRSCTRPPAPGLDIFRIFDSLNDVVARCARPSRRCSTPAPPSPRSPSATPATCMRPGREALHARLLPAPRRADRRHRRPRPRHQGHGRAAARSGRAHGSSRALRERFDLPVHLHTHDTAGGQIGTLLAAIDAGVDAVDAACAADGRARRASRRCRPSSPPPTAPSAPPASTSTRSSRSSPTGRPCASSTRPSSRGCASPTGRVYFHEIPGGQLSQPAPAGDRPRPRRPLRGHRGHVCRGQPDPGQPRQGDAELQGRRRPRPRARRRRRRPGRLRGEPARSTTSPTRSSASSRASSATRPAAGPSRSAPRRCRAARPSRASPS